MKILIADDEKEITQNLQEFLRRKGYVADVAFDGREALDLIKEVDYDLIFLDYNMPELTGLELIKYVKEHNEKTKTVMLTGYPLMEGFFAKAVGADEYLDKPYQFKDIEQIIEKYEKP
ncbi:MAG: response regulator [Candidatus Omnitrophota bacterium]